MPSIQEKLKKQRYGEFVLKMPSKLEVAKHIEPSNRTTRWRINKLDLSNRFISLLQNPPKRDRYYKYYMIVINDFVALPEVTKNSATRRILASTIRLITYFYLFPHKYYDNYEVFGIPLMSHILFSMRKTIMKHKRTIGEIPMIFDFVNPQSNGYYKFPKPMKNQAMIALAHSMHTLLEPAVEICIKTAYINKK